MKTTILNLGPQHPSVHGVLRLVLETSGETVKHSTNEIGFLHRGTEKLCEYMEYYKILPFFSRFDYVGTVSGEQLYSIAIEKSLKIHIPQYSKLVRTLLTELIRITSHLLALTTMAMDTGSITPFLWAFEEREEICQIYELLSGARMHVALIRPGGVNTIITQESLNLLFETLMRLSTKFEELNDLFNNPIFISRLEDIGRIDNKLAAKLSFTGPMRRAGGKARDSRSWKPYDSYGFNHHSPIFFEQNDCLTRYQLRVQEMYQSWLYIAELIDALVPYFKSENVPNLYANCFKLTAPNKSVKNQTMESIIHNFKAYSEGYFISKNKTYVSVESPRGRYGLTLVACDTNRPHRLKLRSPGFYHLQGFNALVKDELVSNILTILGSIDVIMGEVDK